MISIRLLHPHNPLIFVERVKRLVGNEIELGIEIPTIESRASNIPMTKGTTYVVMRSDR